MPTPYGLRPTDALLQQQVYPMAMAGLPGQNVLVRCVCVCVWRPGGGAST